MIILSDKVVVSDPCYTRSTWGAKEGPFSIKSGDYQTSVEKKDEGICGVRISKLIVKHRTDPAVVFEPAPFSVSVDSGQAGVFCDTIYPHGDTGDFDGKGSFYDKCCVASCSQEQYGEIELRGFVASSGFGDGSYPLILGKNEAGEVVHLEITFISDEDEGEEDEGED